MDQHSPLGYWIALGLAAVAVTTVSVACSRGSKPPGVEAPRETAPVAPAVPANAVTPALSKSELFALASLLS